MKNQTPIVAPIFVRPGEAAVALGQIRQAAVEGADWVELRCDEADGVDMEGVLRIIRESSPRNMPSGTPAPLSMAPLLSPTAPPEAALQVIVTLRSGAEGGRFAGTDEELAGAIELAARMGVEWVDVEFERWRRSEELRRRVLAVCQKPARGVGPGIILSAHDFSGRPGDLRKRIVAMAQERSASIIKLAWKAGSIGDAVEALGFIAETQRLYGMPLLPLAMGEFGQISRLLAAKFRAPFTFATLSNDPGSAPGQPTVQDLLGTYRWRAQRPGTAVCGVIGWPVGHSLSPAIHNAGFAAAGFDGVYVPLPIAPGYEDFAAGVDALRGCADMNLRGLSVTIPHKENALRYVRERGGWVDELSAHIGAVNTIVLGEGELRESGAGAGGNSGDGRPMASAVGGGGLQVGGLQGGRQGGVRGGVQGWNSDYAGALDALLAAGGSTAGPQAVAGMRIAVLGAGGAARAIVAALAQAGATVVIYNRTLAKAEALAAEFGQDGKAPGSGKVVAAAWDRLCLSCCQVYIHCTPVGMYPHVEECPVGDEVAFGPGVVVFDTIYNPLETRLLKLARSRGATTISGLEMFVRQAAVQFVKFTGIEAPLELMRQVALRRLEGKKEERVGQNPTVRHD